MNPFMLLGAVAADWTRLSRLLDPAARRELGDTLAELRAATAEGGPDVVRRSAADRAARTVLDGLPPEEADRLRRDGAAQRFTGPPATAVHQGYGALDLTLLVLDGNPMVGPLLGPVRRRLLAEPARPWTEDADPRLIVLSADNGEQRLPLFQFEAADMPWRIVLDVNSLLHADTDPWGVADWWLSPTTWWDGTPADLLGRGRDEELRGAARELAAVAGEG